MKRILFVAGLALAAASPAASQSTAEGLKAACVALQPGMVKSLADNGGPPEMVDEFTARVVESSVEEVTSGRAELAADASIPPPALAWMLCVIDRKLAAGG